MSAMYVIDRAGEGLREAPATASWSPAPFCSWTLVYAARHARHRKPPAQRVEVNFRYATKNLPPSMRIVQVIMPLEGR